MSEDPTVTQPETVLEGAAVRLRPVRVEDLDHVISLISDSSLAQVRAVPRAPVTREEEKQWLASRPPNERRLTIETLQGDYLGAAGLHGIDFVDRNAEVGMVIAEERNWGKGYGGEALQLLVRLAFRSLGLHRVYLRVHAYNERALRLYQRAGFSREGVDREAHFYRGRWHDVVRMALLAPDESVPRTDDSPKLATPSGIPINCASPR